MECIKKFHRLLFIVLSASLLGSCATSSMFSPYPVQAENFKRAIFNGDAGASVNRDSVLLTLERARDSADHMLYMMERGRINQIAHDFSASKTDFEQVILAFEEQNLAATIQAGHTAAQGVSLFTNDNAIPYKGAGYERIFVHLHQAFNYLGMGDKNGAAVEFRKVALEQRILLEQYEKEIAKAYKHAAENGIDVDSLSTRFSGMDAIAGKLKSSLQNAYTFYASAAFWEAAGELNTALIDYKKAFEINPDNHYIQQDIARVSKNMGDDIKQAQTNEPLQGQGSVVIFYEHGFVPAKDEIRIGIPAFDGGIISLAFPYYRSQFWPVAQALRVMGRDFNDLGTSQELVDVSVLAMKHLNEQIPQLLVRQVLRGLMKHQIQTRSGREFGAAGQFAANLYNIISESADRRSWLTLPHTVQAIRINLDAGEQTLNLATMNNQASVQLSIKENKTVFLRVIGVNNQLIPQVFNL